MTVNEVLPRHMFARLDGALPPTTADLAEVYVYGEVKDFAAATGKFALTPTPLVTVKEHVQFGGPITTDSWASVLLAPLPVPGAIPSKAIVEPFFGKRSTPPRFTERSAPACEASLSADDTRDRANVHRCGGDAGVRVRPLRHHQRRLRREQQQGAL